MKPTLDHIERPELPWRKLSQLLTECGLIASEHRTITRTELMGRWKDQGQQRMALTTCMTCLQTAQSWRTWEQDPLDAMQRAIKHDNSAHYNRCWVAPGFNRVNPAVPTETSPLRTELRAIALLIERHSEEFERLIIGLGDVRDLASKRAERKEQKRQERKSPW